MADLSDARARLTWATFAYAQIVEDIDQLEKSTGYRFEVAQGESNSITVRVHDLPAIDPWWRLRLGDCIHGARAALDYLAVALKVHGTNTPAAEMAGMQFPIYDSEKEFAQWEKRYKVPASPWRDRLWDLQPFNAANPNVWGKDTGEPDWFDNALLFSTFLTRIHNLDIIDKHRCLHEIGWYVSLGAGKTPVLDTSATYTGSSSPGVALSEGSLVSTLFFDSDVSATSWLISPTDLLFDYRLMIGFTEPSLDKTVRRILGLSLQVIDWILGQFEPVFRGADPISTSELLTLAQAGQLWRRRVI